MKFQTLLALFSVVGVTAVQLEQSQLSIDNSALIQADGMNQFDITKAWAWIEKNYKILKLMIADYNKEVANRKKARKNAANKAMRDAKKNNSGVLQLDNLPHDLPSLMQLGLSGNKLSQIDYNHVTYDDAVQLLMLSQLDEKD